MRIRKLMVAGLLAMVAVFALSGPAVAQTPTTQTPTTVASTTETTPASGHKVKSEFEQECIDKLEKGSKIDECQKAPSPILPATSELIWGIISFTVLFVLLTKLAWPGIKKGMEARTERIRTDLDAADSAKADAQTVLDEYRAQLADAKGESARIIEEARQTADAFKRDHEQRLQVELAELRTRAAADVEAAKTQAIADLRSEVATLAVGAAEVVIQRNLDRDTQVQLIENYINQVGARSS